VRQNRFAAKAVRRGLRDANRLNRVEPLGGSRKIHDRVA
jgi:hypothetical protein